ncbi:MAG: superfamily [Bryobacterales bacterium]|nr:superfamily [Bryobacterales bacterium]
MPANLLIFDMDGVLVDVTESYRTAIQQTVAHFAGIEVSREMIQDYKNQGGWNDDWALSHRLIQDAGREVAYQDVVDFFQSIFHGEGGNGLIMRERWIPESGLLDRLAVNNALAVFTGRLRWEANTSLSRFAPERFREVVGVDDVTEAKPAPEGIVKIRSLVPHDKIWYIGDTVDDARAAKAAGVPFIGIAAPGSPRVEMLIALLEKEGAIAVLDDINQMEKVVAG